MSTYKHNGIHGGILPRNEIQEMLTRCLRGVAKLEHNQLIEESLVERHKQGDKIATMRLIYSYEDVFSVIICKPARPPRRKAMSQKVWMSPTYQDYEDFFHDTLTMFIELLNEYNPTQGALENYMRGYLHQRVFYYHFREFIVNKMNETKMCEAMLEQPDVEYADDYEKYLPLYYALNKLTKNNRGVVESTIMNGWSQGVAAKELGTNWNRVKVTRWRAIESLKKNLDYEELKSKGVVR